MRYDPTLSFDSARARRADLQARADMLNAAVLDFTRQGRHMPRLEAALARWLIDFRRSFGDDFCIHALLSHLPLPDTATADPIETRLRRRCDLSRTLRRATFAAIARRRDSLGHLSAAEARLATRVHTRAFETAELPCWSGTSADAAVAALDAILVEQSACVAEMAPLSAVHPLRRAL